MDEQEIDKIVRDSENNRGGLITILENIQAKYSYLPEAVLRQVADKTGRSLTDIYGVATFYKSFSLKPRGKHLVSACMGTACHVRGSVHIARQLEKSCRSGPGRRQRTVNSAWKRSTAWGPAHLAR